METRTIENLKHPLGWSVNYTVDGKPNAGYPAEGHVLVGETIDRTSSTVPRWKDRIARNEGATGGLFLLRSNVGEEVAYCRESWETSYYPNDPTKKRYSHVVTNTGTKWTARDHLSIADPGFDSNIQGAKSAWTRKLQSARRSAYAAVTAGEAAKTTQMIRDRAKRTSDMMSRYMDAAIDLRKKHGLLRLREKWGNAMADCVHYDRDRRSYNPHCRSWTDKELIRVRKYLEDANGLYLEATFGWYPLVQDSVMLATAFGRNGFRHVLDRQVLMSKHTIPYTKEGSAVVYGMPRTLLVPHRWKVETTLTKSIKYLGAVLLDSAAYWNYRKDDRMLTDFGLGPGDYAVTLWELLPWTWAVDYFSNVGLLLDSMASPSVRLAWSQTTEVTETKTKWHSLYFLPNGVDTSPEMFMRNHFGPTYVKGSYRLTSSGSLSYTSVRLKRTAGTPTDMSPKLEFRVPRGHPVANVLSALTGKYRAFRKLL